jgi:DNA-binding FrmR family transcriptional regulator
MKIASTTAKERQIGSSLRRQEIKSPRRSRQSKRDLGPSESKIRKALAVEPAIKTSNLNRLRRIEGQVRGLQKMVEEDRYCPDILVQIASVQEALRGIGRALMQNHLQHCATDVLKHGTKDDARQMYDELLELIYRYLR